MPSGLDGKGLENTSVVVYMGKIGWRVVFEIVVSEV